MPCRRDLRFVWSEPQACSVLPKRWSGSASKETERCLVDANLSWGNPDVRIHDDCLLSYSAGVKHQSKNKRRLFFAVWPDTKTLTALLDAQNSISAMKARPVPAENLHITLVFIGSASKETERCLVDAASGLLVGVGGILICRTHS